MPAEDDKRAELKRMAYVARLWQAFADGGVDELSLLVPADVDWSPPGVPTALHGTDELRSFMDAHPERDMPLPIGYEPHRDGVLVHAERLDSQKGMTHVWLLYRFDGDRLVEALSFDDEDEARAAPRR